MSARIQLLLLLAVLAVSFGSILARLAGSPPLVIAFWRLALASLILWPFVLLQPPNKLRSCNRRQLALMGLAGLALALHFAAWISSLFLTTVANATVLVSTQVLFIAAGEWLVLRKVYPRSFYLAVALALAGIVLIAGSDLRIGTGTDLAGDLLALAGAAMAALYFYLGSLLRDRIPIAVYGAVVYTAAALLLAAAVLASGQSLLPPSALSWLYLALLALGPQLLGHTGLNYLLAHVQPAYITIVLLGEPIGATLWALLIFGELPSTWALAGSVLILAALAIIPRRQLMKLSAA